MHLFTLHYCQVNKSSPPYLSSEASALLNHSRRLPVEARAVHGAAPLPLRTRAEFFCLHFRNLWQSIPHIETILDKKIVLFEGGTLGWLCLLLLFNFQLELCLKIMLHWQEADVIMVIQPASPAVFSISPVSRTPEDLPGWHLAVSIRHLCQFLTKCSLCIVSSSWRQKYRSWNPWKFLCW